MIAKIPEGKVATYGQIAHLAGWPRHARHVGHALAALEDDDVPWHRVINAKGEISARGLPEFAERQQQRLRRENVTVDRRGRISLERYQWLRDPSVLKSKNH